MSRSSQALASILLLCLSCRITATLLGDEDFGSNSTGLFYVFADQAIHAISPGNVSVVKNITTDQAGNLLTSNGSVSGTSTTPRKWNDAVFIQGATSRYVFANEADLYLESDNQTQFGYTTIVDANKQQVVARLKVGARPVHVYAVNQTQTIWTHSDAEGRFYLIPTNNSQNLSVARIVPSFVNAPGHGKLVVNDDLYPVSYGTNVAESIISKFNLQNATRTNTFQYNTSLTNASSCAGTHTIVYSRVNKHLFIECADSSGILEWNTVNDTVVRLHNIVGVVTGAPADDMIFVGNSLNSTATMIKPGANGQASSFYALMSVPYNPDYPAFWSSGSSTGNPTNFTNYQIYFPLTRNTNINNIRAGGNNITTAAYMSMPSDCQYGASTVSTSSVGSSSSLTGMSLALASNGTLLTPNCGACAPGINSSDPSQFNASLSGFGAYDLSKFSSGPQNTTTTLIPAGATKPSQSAQSGANQCSFTTSNHRAIKRGGNYVVTVASYPQPSVYIINPSSSSVGSQFAATAPNPTALSWAPSV